MSFFSQPFMQHALLAGTGIALVSGLAGYFLVLRGQVFAGDALSHVTFTGAFAALAIGIDLRIGLFVLAVGFGLLMGAVGRGGRADDVVVGSTFAWVLGLGVLFLSIYTRSGRSGNAGAGVSVLFGSILGLSATQAVLSAAVSVAVAAVILTIARPLLFSSLDPAVAAARGVPVRALGVLFLALVGATAALATQAVGALLLLGLLAAPAGTAQRLTARPFLALVLSASLAVVEVWVGLAVSYALPRLPPSFAIIAVASGTYLVVLLVSRLRAHDTGGSVSETLVSGEESVPSF